ncbi:MAG: hypothetical protein E7370_03070 [Clostridiales bacterium]|nr:hypothetical protein [Clostridiales bacterium]
MNKKLVKVIVSGVLATSFAFTCFAGACTSTQNPPPANTDTYTITFNYNDAEEGSNGSRPAKKYVDKGESSEACADPERVGYDFVGWATTQNAEASDVTFPYTPTQNVTLYAVWTPGIYTVTFDHNYENATADTVEVEYNNEVNAPETDPVRDGYNFRRWNNKAENGDAVVFPYVVTEDVTFYAEWVEEDVKLFDLYFDYNFEGVEEELPSILGIVPGESIGSADAPALSRVGCNFIGWATSPDATTVEECVTFPYTPNETSTLYAVWQQNFYNIRFRYNYVDAPDSGNYEYRQGVGGGTKLDPPEVNPTREGYTFIGWYSATYDGELIDFTDMLVSKSISYFAHWEKDLVQTDVFEAEFCYYDSKVLYPGYSGGLYGAAVVQHETLEGMSTPSTDEVNTVHPDRHGHYVTYLFSPGITVEFKVYSSQAVSGATLIANLGSELPFPLMLTTTGEHGYDIQVNGESLTYNITVPGTGSADISAKTGFAEYTIGNINLVEGWNSIKLITNNSTNCGGTRASCAPIIDCIKIKNYGDATLSYSPIYDNLWYSNLS